MLCDAGRYELSVKGRNATGQLEDLGYYYFDVRTKRGRANQEAAIKRIGNNGTSGSSCVPIEVFDCHPCSYDPLQTCCSVTRAGWTSGAPGTGAFRLPVGSILPLGGGGGEKGYVVLTW